MTKRSAIPPWSWPPRSHDYMALVATLVFLFFGWKWRGAIAILLVLGIVLKIWFSFIIVKLEE